jgi:hypothetical protein
MPTMDLRTTTCPFDRHDGACRFWVDCICFCHGPVQFKAGDRTISQILTRRGRREARQIRCLEKKFWKGVIGTEVPQGR